MHSSDLLSPALEALPLNYIVIILTYLVNIMTTAQTDILTHVLSNTFGF